MSSRRGITMQCTWMQIKPLSLMQGDGQTASRFSQRLAEIEIEILRTRPEVTS